MRVFLVLVDCDEDTFDVELRPRVFPWLLACRGERSIGRVFERAMVVCLLVIFRKYYVIVSDLCGAGIKGS